MLSLEFTIKWVPLLIIGIVYYSYIIEYTIPLMFNTYTYRHLDHKLPFLFILVDLLEYFPFYYLPIEDEFERKGYNMFLTFNILFIMGLICAYKTMVTNPGKIPEEYSKSQEDKVFKAILNREPEMLQKLFGQRDTQISKNDAKKIVDAMVVAGLFCKKCNLYTPPRASHCVICKQCILKHEYHNPLYRNCIGYDNLKFYCLSNFYFLLSFIYMSITYFKCFLETWVYKQTLLSAVSNSLLFLAGCGLVLLFGYLNLLHFMLIKENATINERIARDNSHQKYNLGIGSNFRQVFGQNPKYWLIPVRPKKSKGKGLYFKEKDLDMHQKQE